MIITFQSGADKMGIARSYVSLVIRHCCFGVFWMLALLGSAAACTEDTMLNFIGSLEAPRGYDQVYYGVKHAPPRPITTMTVQEVLDWQRVASRTAVSSAAGQYQVIRATLKGVVKNGVVRLSDPFDAATQDAIGRHLLRQTGYRNGVATPAVANRIAGVWAALPKVSGAGAGGSVYEGYAGNHSLVDVNTYMGVLNCSVDVAEAKVKSAIIREGVRIGFNFNRIIEIIAEQSVAITQSASKYAMYILFLLLAADFVIRFGRLVIENQGLGAFVQSYMFKALAVMLFIFIIQYAGTLVKFIADTGVEIAQDAVGKDGYSLAGYAREKTTLILSLFEGITAKSSEIGALMIGITLLVIITTGLQMGLVVYTYAELFIVATSGFIVMGFGGLTALHGDVRRYIFRIIGGGLRVCALLIVLHLGLELTQIIRGEFDVTMTGFAALMVDIIVLFLSFTIPRSVASLTRG